MSSASLARRLGTGDAIVVGLSAMIGAGVFVVFAPAAEVAGAGLLVGLAIAAVIAFCNAVASAQLAMSHPASGGTYLFGRVVLGPWWGFTAGWGFVVGKTASCAAMALTFGAYALPDEAIWWHRAVATVAVMALTMANLRGITRTARLARVLLTATLATLVLVVVVCLFGAGHGADTWPAGQGPGTLGTGPFGVLQAAGLLFFAFAGYARIATLAEEVREPAVLGRAILWALGMAVTLYAVVAFALLHTLGPRVAGQVAPLAAAMDATGAGWAQPLVRVGAAAACLGALLALMAGVGRTTLAMARERDLPAVLSSVHPRYQVPDHAQVAIAVAILLLVWVADLRAAIGFSSFGVLVYYAVANLSALRQPAAQRRWPRALNLLGLVGCVVLAVTLPWQAVVVGGVVFAVGLAGRAVVVTRRRQAVVD